MQVKKETHRKEVCECGGIMTLRECQQRKTKMYLADIMGVISGEPEMIESEEGDKNETIRFVEHRYFCTKCHFASHPIIAELL